jgi:hypothetical protein
MNWQLAGEHPMMIFFARSLHKILRIFNSNKFNNLPINNNPGKKVELVSQPVLIMSKRR